MNLIIFILFIVFDAAVFYGVPKCYRNEHAKFAHLLPGGGLLLRDDWKDAGSPQCKEGLPEGAVSVLKPTCDGMCKPEVQGTEETGADRPAAPFSSTPHMTPARRPERN